MPPKRRYPLSTRCHILEDNNTKSPDDHIHPAPCIMSVTPRRTSVIHRAFQNILRDYKHL